MGYEAKIIAISALASSLVIWANLNFDKIGILMFRNLSQQRVKLALVQPGLSLVEDGIVFMVCKQQNTIQWGNQGKCCEMVKKTIGTNKISCS